MMTEGLHHQEKIVIVGAGYAGISLALQLLKAEMDFVIINQSEVFHNNFASVRAIVKQDYAWKTLIPLKETFGNRFICGKVTNIDPDQNTVTLKCGKYLVYGTLVLAIGRYDSWPFKIGQMCHQDACRKYDEFAKRMAGAKGIVIVGGGPTGVETAAEIASGLKDVAVTLIHSSDILLSEKVSIACRRKVHEALENMKINVILGEKVVNLSALNHDNSLPREVRTDKGRVLEAGMVIDCTGIAPRPNTRDFCLQSLGTCRDEVGSLKVNEYLQLEGHINIFAIGDCNNVMEPKLGYLAGVQGRHLATSLEAKLSNDSPRLPYQTNQIPFEMMVTLGPELGLVSNKDGTFQWNEGYVLVKQKTLLNEMFWEDMKQRMPKNVVDRNNT